MSKTSQREGDDERAAAQGFVTGTISGFLIVAGIAMGISLNAGADVVPALGTGAFAGFWGGPGFGGMIGATLACTRLTKERQAAEELP